MLLVSLSLIHSVQFSSVQSLSRVRLFATPSIAARKASLSITNSRSSLKLASIESLGEVNRKSLVTLVDGETIGTGASSSRSVQKE